jgi:hypothetical protein
MGGVFAKNLTYILKSEVGRVVRWQLVLLRDSTHSGKGECRGGCSDGV